MRTGCPHKPEAELWPLSNEDYVVTGLEVLLASVVRRNTQVDAFVDATKNTVSDDIFHVLHYTPLGSV